VHLEDHRANVHSQFGEDGMIREALRLLPDVPKWCVEFGAWDGRYKSNTRRLIWEDDWSAVLIEADPQRFRDLESTYADSPSVTCLHGRVDRTGPGRLDALLAGTAIPQDFGLLSIDVDGDDWHLWEAVAEYTPALVVVEFNATIPADEDFVQPYGVHQGSSLAAFARLAAVKGYELVGVTDWNALLVRAEHFPLFEIEDNSPEVMHHGRFQSRVFQLFDGTLVWRGQKELVWHGVRIDRQVVPRPLRNMPGNEPSRLVALAWKLWVRVARRRSGGRQATARP
jgi:hypothetical protein